MAVKNILLTGASGTVGFEVLKQLLKKKDYQVIVFDKKTSHSKKKLKPYINSMTLIYGDLSQPKDVEMIPTVDAVIHLAAIIPPVADDLPELAEQVNVEGTKNLIRHIETIAPSSFFIYSSSISVYGDRIDQPFISVGDALQPSARDAYAVTKIKAERLLQDSSLDYVIFRLAAIMGNHKISKLMFHQPLNTALEIATPRDTARAFVNGLEKRKALSKNNYNLGGGENCRISYQHFLERSFAIFGLGKVNFPKYAFADKNFHCGFYEDGDELEQLLHFRRDSLEDYFDTEEQKVSGIQKFITQLFKGFIKWYLLKKSEPFQAFKTKDADEMNHYFNLKQTS